MLDFAFSFFPKCTLCGGGLRVRNVNLIRLLVLGESNYPVNSQGNT